MTHHTSKRVGEISNANANVTITVTEHSKTGTIEINVQPIDVDKDTPAIDIDWSMFAESTTHGQWVKIEAFTA